MGSIESLRALEKIKLLSDPRRLEILCLFMASPATLYPMLDQLQTIDFRRSLDSLTGYTVAHSGEIVRI